MAHIRVSQNYASMFGEVFEFTALASACMRGATICKPVISLNL